VGSHDFRWQTMDAGSNQPTLFDLPEREIGIGEYRGLEFLHVRAKKIINHVGPKSPVPFDYTINAYRGCSHACAYCQWGETPILMADGSTMALADIRTGDLVYGTELHGTCRRYVITPVLDHWSTIKHAYRVVLDDGTRLVASGDHRYLSGRGWKHVVGTECDRSLQRPHLTLADKLLGTGRFALGPKEDDDYRRGYLCGMIRGDGMTHRRRDRRGSGAQHVQHQLRRAPADDEGLERTQRFLSELGVATRSFGFQVATATRRALGGTRTASQPPVERIVRLVEWPDAETDEWTKGFLAGIFDADGSCSGSAVRIANKDQEIVDHVVSGLERFGFGLVVEGPARSGARYVRLVGGLRERMRFVHTTDPAISGKRSIEGMALESGMLRVVDIEDLGVELPMYDITTGTGDFIADGVVSHNCFARPTHEYLGLDPAVDFDRVIVVKTNAVEKLRAELAPSRWGGHHIAMGTNTDPYQRAEGKYRLTRGIVEVLTAARNPFSILTKGTLVLRDLDVLVEATKHTRVELCFSIGTLDPEVWRATEPGTPHPRQRIEAVARLNEAGVPCGVLVAPILPGLSDRDDQLDEVIGACVDAGARSISPVLLHLRPGVREHYLGWLAEAHPELLARHARTYRRAYAPSEQRQHLSARVRALIASHRRRAGGRTGPRLSSRFDPA
jgi:DNA repair photolyase